MLRHLIVASCLALAATVAGAQGAGYPNRPVKIIVPWPPGGSNDITGRLAAKVLTEATGQSFVVENRPGAGGTIGADAVAKSAPDGYTLMVHSGTHVANAFTYKSLPYQTLKDFVPVATIAAQTLGLAVTQNSPARTVGDLLARARSQPGKVVVTSSGIGSGAHLQITLIEQGAGIQVLHVPYKGGNPQMNDLMSGETEAGVFALASIVSAVQSGKVRLLAIAANERSALFPNVPTMAEAGVKTFDFTPWISMFAPAGTPEPVLNRLHSELQKALQREDVKQSLLAQGLDPLPLSREQFTRRLVTDYTRYGQIIESTSRPGR